MIVLFGALIGMAVAGFPSRREDPPLTVQAATGTSTSSSVLAPTTTTPTTSTTTSLRPVADVRVMVFNASGVPGTATRIGNRIKAKGWNLKPPGADRPAQPTTAVMYKPGFDNEARSLTAELDLPTTAATPLTAAVSAADADLALLVGEDLAKRPG